MKRFAKERRSFAVPCLLAIEDGARQPPRSLEATLKKDADSCWDRKDSPVRSCVHRWSMKARRSGPFRDSQFDDARVRACVDDERFDHDVGSENREP